MSYRPNIIYISAEIDDVEAQRESERKNLMLNCGDIAVYAGLLAIEGALRGAIESEFRATHNIIREIEK